VKGVGPKTALKLVREHKTVENVFGQVKWTFTMRPEEIVDFFKNPPVKDLEIKKENLQPEKLVSFMVEEHDFSQDRMESQVKRLEKAMEEGKQKGLGGFLG